MANEYLDDFEQAEAVKKWIRTNGGAIVGGIALGLAGLFGWQYWQQHVAEQQVLAAEGYQQLANDVAAGNVPEQPLQQFEQAYGSDTYVAFAALILAEDAAATGDTEQAMQYLQRASEIAEPEGMRHVAGLRLARLQKDAGQFEQALATAERHGVDAFQALAAEIRGDILVAMGDRDAARSAYQFALANLEAGGDRNLLEMKLDSLAVAAEGEST